MTQWWPRGRLRPRRYPQRALGSVSESPSGHNGVMLDRPMPEERLLAPAQVGEILGVPVEQVVELIMDGRLRGMRVGSPPSWRIDEVSVSEYIDDQTEETRRMALWRQSNAASFPELWGTGAVRSPD